MLPGMSCSDLILFFVALKLNKRHDTQKDFFLYLLRYVPWCLACRMALILTRGEMYCAVLRDKDKEL